MKILLIILTLTLMSCGETGLPENVNVSGSVISTSTVDINSGIVETRVLSNGMICMRLMFGNEISDGNCQDVTLVYPNVPITIALLNEFRTSFVLAPCSPEERSFLGSIICG